MHVRIIKKDRETGKWNQVKIYRKEKGKRKFHMVKASPFRNRELFNILNENEDEKYHANAICISDLPIDLKREIEKCKSIKGYYGFKEINLADLKLYLHESPKVRNYDYEENDINAWKDNPVKNFIERIEQYIDFANPYWDIFQPVSDIKIVYWFDC